MKNIINRRMTRAKRMAQWLLLPVDLVISPALIAQRNAAILDHAQSSSILNVGYRQLPPFSSIDRNGKVTGYAIAVCNMVADKLRQYLKLDNLTIYYISVDPSGRFSALNSRKIDMDCGVDTNAPERTSSASFSEGYCTAEMRIISLCKSNIRSIAGLKGRTASLIGSSEDLLKFNKANRERHLNVSTIISTTIKGTFEKVTYDEFAAFSVDDVLAWPLINHSERPELFSVSSESIGNDMHYAIMMGKSDSQFMTFANGTLRDFFASPANVQLRKEWLPLQSCEKLKNSSPGGYQHSH